MTAQYESITFDQVHHDILHLLPAEPVRAIDIGAGTGRDAAALAARGHRVLAVEPTAELLAEARRLHPDPRIEWLDDGLPELARVRARAERYDLAFLTAVWMHLDAAEREAAMAALASVMAPHGLVFMTLRHGPVPPGRRMFDVSADETAALAVANRLTDIHRGSRGDMLSRRAVTWSVLAFRRTGA
ncbi:class I SAM-dependent methyltransferase [Phreatobacter stygius]|uniref:Class I SAM-dependent methyltransferase n=1 Tax=Phreatobacter stygius TaxID=1940610 RepID=A0A4D7BJX7_9HYPH|nr:class I SAM-dependent methyltransferase [Phreatobacter stygius]